MKMYGKLSSKSMASDSRNGLIGENVRKKKHFSVEKESVNENRGKVWEKSNAIFLVP